MFSQKLSLSRQATRYYNPPKAPVRLSYRQLEDAQVLVDSEVPVLSRKKAVFRFSASRELALIHIHIHVEIAGITMEQITLHIHLHAGCLHDQK